MPQTPQLETKSTIASGDARPNLTKAHFLTIFAAGLFACFFFPWMTIIFSKPSGFDLAKGGGKYLVLWFIPLFCLVTILAGLTKQKSQKSIAVFTGVVPFVILGLGLYENGKDLIQLLNSAAYISLGLGLILILLPSELKYP